MTTFIIILLVLVLVVSFIAGVLVGRRNPKKADALAADVQAIGNKINPGNG